MTRRKIGADDFDVALLEDVADGRADLFHTLSLYVARNVVSPAYPLFVEWISSNRSGEMS